LTNQLPIQQEDRTVIVDILRGFALFGVLQGNLSGMLTNNVPETIMDAHATVFDHLLLIIHNIFIENKFITLFSVLFGYGFGVIMERLERKNINSTAFFLRRMFWLFLFGCLNLVFWNGDILHLYAITGVLLLLFKKLTNRSLLWCSIFFLFVLPTIIRLYQHFFLKYTVNEDLLVANYYQAYKWGSLEDVAMVNYRSYFPQWIYTWTEWRDISETLGRFLLGYYILRRQFLVRLDENISLIKKLWKWTLGIILPYICVLILTEWKWLSIPRYILFPILRIGVMSTALFYATTLIRLYMRARMGNLMQTFRNLGRMTLTNYLMQTTMYVIIFYHVGFGLLGDFSFGVIWLLTFLIYFSQAWFSQWWLSKFYYGPVEWVWRQLTYRRRFKLIKDSMAVSVTK
jgi:uncharacterized protein